MASEKALAYFENYHIEYDAALALQEKAATALAQAIEAMILAFDDDDEEECSRHTSLYTMLQVQNVTATLEWETGEKIELSGTLRFDNLDNKESAGLVSATFIGTPVCNIKTSN